MIEFITLFLGLVAGPRMVEVEADQQVVAAVELRLDGESVGRLESPPWEFEVDFGLDIVPRRLEAVAYDADRVEVGRAEQLVNVPRPPAEANIVLLRGEEGQVEAARLSWESSVRTDPKQIRARLDGTDLPVENPEKIELAGLSPQELHFLQVELIFTNDVIAQAQIAFGGEHLDTTSAALTGFPVVKNWKGDSPDPSSMQGWFHDGDEPLRVAAVDKGLSEVVVVRGPGVASAVLDLQGAPTQTLSSGRIPNEPGTTAASPGERQRQALTLAKGSRLRVLIPQTRTTRGRRVEMESFAISPEISPKQGGMLMVLSQEVLLPGLASQIRVNDAVAVAGLQAANGNRRRAVVLVLATPWKDASRWDAPTVERFLDSLNVPLYVWELREGEGGADVWSRSETVTNYRELARAERELERDLEQQRIVWFEGTHLPNSIRISETANVESVTTRP